jgi:hypothetical protein
MRNIYIYYIAILVPLIVIILIRLTYGSDSLFAILLLIYALIYRPVTDSIRLIKKKVIQKGEIWKIFIPFFWRTKWFKELYFSKY